MYTNFITELSMVSNVEGKVVPTFTDWLIKTGLGQFEKKLRQVGIKDVSSFTELDNDDLNEMKINDAKSRLSLMSVAQYMSEKSTGLSHKQLPLLMKQDSMEPTSFSEHSDKVSIAIVGSSGSGKTNLAVQFISGKYIYVHVDIFSRYHTWKKFGEMHVWLKLIQKRIVTKNL